MATDPAAEGEEPKRSAVEGIKETSRWLRGTLAEELARSDSDHFGDEDKQLLKFHGSYQQEDRDARKARSKAGVGKHYMFMVRLKLPGGKMTGKQWLALDEIAGTHANGTLRLTTRQGIQFHGILKSKLRQSLQDMNAALISTLGACGDVNRNVIACPAPFRTNPAPKASAGGCRRRASGARSNAYDIWLSGSNSAPTRAVRRSRADLRRSVCREISRPLPAARQLRGPVLQRPRVLPAIERVGHRIQRVLAAAAWATSGNRTPHLAQPLCFVEPTRWSRPPGRNQVLPRSRQPRRPQASTPQVRDSAGDGQGPRSLRLGLLAKPIRRPRRRSKIDLHRGWHPQVRRQMVPGSERRERPRQGRDLRLHRRPQDRRALNSIVRITANRTCCWETSTRQSPGD